MSLGEAPKHEDLFRSSATYCEDRMSETSIYRLLREQGDRLFADESFADLFGEIGRRSVSPRVVATVMVLQRVDGLSDREAVDRFSFDMRWKLGSPAGVNPAAATMEAMPILQSCRPSSLRLLRETSAGGS